MTSAFLFILGIIIILCIARFNRSVTLFWYMLLSMVAGIIGSKAAEMLSNDSNKQTSTYVVTKPDSTQSCCMDLFDVSYSPTDSTNTQSYPRIESLFIFSNRSTNFVLSPSIRGHPSFFNTS